jgi:MYXO-CTERM domain-containing protein
MRTALALCAAAFLVPLAASAQITLSSDQSSGTSPQIYIGKAACKTKVINFTWDVGIGHPTIAEEVDIIHARSNTTCSSTSVTAPDTDVPALSQTQRSGEAVNAKDMILDSADGGSFPGGCDNTDRGSGNPYTTYYCVQLKPTSTFAGTPQFQFIPINFAMKPPTAPINLVVNAGDQHLKVNWSAGDPGQKIATYDVHALLPDGGGAGPNPAAHVSSSTNADVTATDDGTPLQDNVPYDLTVVATDVYGNISPPSATATATPIHILDFYNLYRSEGGSATGGGGCSSTGAAAWIAALALLVGLFARRRSSSRKKASGAALIAGLALLAPGARADWRPHERPPRYLLLALKIDRYDPQIDSERGFAALPANDRPYHQIFHGRAPLRSQLEVDWEIAHPFGSLLLGGTVGYWQNIGKGLTADTKVPSGDTALLDIIPFGAIATYRFDYLADRWPRFPFIPYAQIGLMRALWVSFSGTGAVSKDATRGGRGSGWTYGYTTALGMAFNLNAIDPELAREIFVDVGIQRTSLFAEYGWTRLDDFGKGNPLILSDRSWRFGLAVEF